MEKFEVHILGCGCAVPTTRHNPSAQIVDLRGKLSLIDCGEGTQLQLRHSHVRFMQVRNIFISHTHGDHCLGLIGLISSFGLLGRANPLHVYAPADYAPLFRRQLDYFCRDLPFAVTFHPVDTAVASVIFDDRSMSVTSLPLDHRMPCCGFLFREKPTLPHIRRDMIDFYGIPVSQINNIKNGADWIMPNGTVIPNARLTRPAEAPRAYAYCSDTAYLPSLVPLLEGVNLLYHESTYAADRMARAKLYRHSTAAQAATIARDAHVGQLLIGHYSAHYHDESVLLDEARAIFPNTIAADEGLCVPVVENLRM